MREKDREERVCKREWKKERERAREREREIILFFDQKCIQLKLVSGEETFSNQQLLSNPICLLKLQSNHSGLETKNVNQNQKLSCEPFLSYIIVQDCICVQ